MRFKDKVAIITGGADGIARATARILAKEGASVVAADINTAGLKQLKDEIDASKGNILTVHANVLEPPEVDDLVKATVNHFGKVDILVNAVGGSTVIANSRAYLDELSLEEWDRILEFNLRGTFLCSSKVLRQMKAQGTGGKIVNISSLAGHGISATSSSAYSAAKAGIMALTRKVAREAGPYGITCNAIAPGATASSRTSLNAGLTDQQKRELVDPVPLGRIAQPEDQAKVIAFLASGDADYVTGVIIDVNGGRY